ncbi:MAG: FtsX-like permease family protein [Rhodothermales bacterium]|nr:FtsX-like permease family protein [Rhodothermales bacterium]
MRFADLLRLGLANLRRNRTRSLLTLAGVMIGVAALLALLAHGAAIKRTARSEFERLELYNTLRLTSRPSPFSALTDLSARTLPLDDEDNRPPVPITDSLLTALARLDGVLAAYPEVVFPVEIKANGRSVAAQAEAVPPAFAAIPSYRPAEGTFFRAATDSALLLGASMARRLGFDDPTRAVGATVTLETVALDLGALQRMGPAIAFGLTSLPLNHYDQPMRVAGLLPEDGQPISGFFRVVLPLERARTLRKLTFFSTIDLILRDSYTDEGYPAARVQLATPDAYAPVRAAIEAEGVYVTSFREQFGQVERLFFIMDLALGIIGTIALLVATLGITNTMMMNVMERRREIGVMKAVGGVEGDLQRLFLVESGTLGLVGGVLGLLAGWGLTAVIQFIVDVYLGRLGVPEVAVFYQPPGLWLAILGGAVLVSVLAGLAPARRAARTEPIAALRSV